MVQMMGAHRAPHVTRSCITAENLSIQFNGRKVVDELNLEIPQGEIFGLIGPSGCGKSTVVKALVGLLRPTTGDVHVLGTEPVHFGKRERRAIGYTPQGFNLYPTLTLEENARFVAGLYGIGPVERRRRIRETLEFLELWDARKRLARDASGGMQRRLSLACALLHQPQLLFVDEPTAGLDPLLRAKIWDHLGELRDSGVTILVTTQLIEEANNCDRLGILSEGRMLTQGSPEAIRRSAIGGDSVEVTGPGFTVDDVRALWAMPDVIRVHWLSSQRLRVDVAELGEATAQIGTTLADRGTEVTAIDPHVPSFDDVFAAVVGEKA